MVRFVRLCFGMLVRLFFRRQSLLLENLALRQQLVMLKRRHPRPSFGFEVIAAVKATRMIPKRTSFRSPWQNGIAERWGSCRRDLLDHIVALNERHLKRLLAEYVRYHHEDRTHLGLEKATPDCRIRSVASGRVLAQERLGGLHHRYDRAA